MSESKDKDGPRIDWLGEDNGDESPVKGKRKSRTRNQKLLTADVLQGLFEGDSDVTEDILLEAMRPQTRADCVDGPRPCIFVGCPHNLYLDVNPATGSMQLNFPDLDPHQMDPEWSCALDVADREGETLEAVGEGMHLTRERIRQTELAGLRKLREHPAAAGLFRDAVGVLPGLTNPPLEEPEINDEDAKFLKVLELMAGMLAKLSPQIEPQPEPPAGATEGGSVVTVLEGASENSSTAVAVSAPKAPTSDEDLTIFDLD